VSIVRSPRARARKPAGRRFLRGPAAAAAALAVAGALAGPAQANLAATGPVNPSTGYPDWYQDANGLKVQLCVDGTAACSAAPGDLTAPGGESFWWYVTGDVTLPSGGTASLVLGQEAAFLDNGRISFGRVRVTIKGARPNASYTATHPFGSVVVDTDVLGNGRFTEDVGCGAAPCAWDAALQTSIGPFLTWDPRVAPAAPAGYIGDAVTPHAVIGSPTGDNAFGVSSGADAASTAQFLVQGKLAGPPVPVANGPSSLGFGSQPVGTAATQTVELRSFGVPATDGSSNLTVRGAGVSGAQAPEFQIVGDTCAGNSLPSGATCSVSVRFTPGAAGPRTAALDVAHNATGGATRIVLAGNGLAPPAPAGPAAAPGPRVGVAGFSAAGGLALRQLRITHRISRALALRRGLRLSMRLPQGTEVVRVAIYRVRDNRRSGPAIFLAHRVPPRAGLYRVRLDSRALRQRLVRGSYQLNVTPGLSRHELGRTTVTRLRVTAR
jgi:hypothetical protein